MFRPDGLPIERVDATGKLYYHHDALGSTRALTDKNGAVVVTYTYDPYGKATPSTTSIANPFQYAGQYTDPTSGLIYMRARYYDPGTGTFLTRDPIEAQTREPYGYVGGNPLNAIDPAGLNKCEVGANPLRWAGNAIDCASKARVPDYVTVDATAFAPIGLIPFGPGGGVNVTLTRSGRVFVGGEWGTGSAGPPTVSIRGGWLNQCKPATDSQVDTFTRGLAATVSGTLGGISIGETNGLPGKATEVGVGIGEGFSATSTEDPSWLSFRTPFRW